MNKKIFLLVSLVGVSCISASSTSLFSDPSSLASAYYDIMTINQHYDRPSQRTIRSRNLNPAGMRPLRSRANSFTEQVEGAMQTEMSNRMDQESEELTTAVGDIDLNNNTAPVTARDLSVAQGSRRSAVPVADIQRLSFPLSATNQNYTGQAGGQTPTSSSNVSFRYLQENVDNELNNEELNAMEIE